MPAGVDAAEAAALILSWTTAYQLLHRAARVQRGQRVLVQGAAGAVGQALLVLGRLAGLELWGTARGAHAALIRELGATPIDYQREDFTRVLPGGFDVVFDGIGEDGYRRSFAALKRGGLLCAYGYTAGVQAQRRLLTILMWIARVYLWRRLLSWLPGGKRLRVYSINVMRARHPAWFREDLERLFGLLATRAIRPRVAERISFDEVAEAHRRLEAGGLEGKLVLCPDLPSRRDRVPPQHALARRPRYQIGIDLLDLLGDQAKLWNRLRIQLFLVTKSDRLERQDSFARLVHRLNVLLVAGGRGARAQVTAAIDDYAKPTSHRHPIYTSDVGVGLVAPSDPDRPRFVGAGVGDVNIITPTRHRAARGIPKRNIARAGLTVPESKAPNGSVADTAGVGEQCLRTGGHILHSHGVLVERLIAVGRVPASGVRLQCLCAGSSIASRRS